MTKKKNEIQIKKSTIWWTVGIILGVLLFSYIIGSLSNNNSYQENTQNTNNNQVKQQVQQYCGDGSCSYSESCSICPSDCGECPKDIKEKIKQYIVFVKYDVAGKNSEGSYFESGGTGSGVIVANIDNELTIYTNRHVVDCEYNDINCFQRISERVQVRTQDGQLYNVNEVSFSKSEVDLAILTVKIPNAKDYDFTYYTDESGIGDKVIAVGYPAYAPNIVELSVAEGTITNIKEVLSQSTGDSFRTIESDAYTYFGSSGGGLFDEQGSLIGINTWLAGTQKSIAIDFNSIREQSFVYCDSSSYFADGNCYGYCDREKVMGNNRACYSACGNDFYCETNPPQVNDPRCQDSGYILGNDGYCHQPCGSGYCAQGNYCFKNSCISCENPNTYLFKDGTCRLYE